jgi:hypothetical protein
MSQWKHSLFGCIDSAEIFCLTCFFTFYWRTKIRNYVEKQKELVERTFIVDCLITTYLDPCALQQECRELGNYTAPGDENMADDDCKLPPEVSAVRLLFVRPQIPLSK